MKYNKQILSVLFAALAFGAMPQAQGMGYFRNAYNGVSAFARKAMASASAVNSQALARISAIVNHIIPASEIKTEESAQPQLVLAGKNLVRLGIIKNHLNPYGDTSIQSHNCSNVEKTAIQRAHIIANHIAPEINTTTLSANNCADIAINKENYMQTTLNDYLNWFYNDPIEKIMPFIGHEIGIEEISNTTGNTIGTLNFYKKDDENQIYTRFVGIDNSLLGFCIGKINSETKEGYISFLHVAQKTRQGGYGKILLAYTTKKLFEFGCTSIKGQALSFDLRESENRDQMQPKLEGFYKQFGAESCDQNNLSNLELKL